MNIKKKRLQCRWDMKFRGNIGSFGPEFPKISLFAFLNRLFLSEHFTPNFFFCLALSLRLSVRDFN